MTALGLVLCMSYVVFGVGALASVAILWLARPLLANREHRRRVIGILALVALLAVCMVVGQHLLDAVYGHLDDYHRPHDGGAVAPGPAR